MKHQEFSRIAIGLRRCVKPLKKNFEQTYSEVNVLKCNLPKLTTSFFASLFVFY